MECNKVFSGDCPEITTFIVKYLRNDLNSLYSCALVNRLFCKITIPLLWEDPFLVANRGEYSRSLLDTYFLFFDERDRIRLEELNISIRTSSFSKPFFNYPEYIKSIDGSKLLWHLDKWKDEHYKITRPSYSNIAKSTFLLENDNIIIYLHDNLLESTETKQSVGICRILIELFIKYNVSLNNLRMTVAFFYSMQGIFLDNLHFISDIESLHIDFFTGLNNDLPLSPLYSTIMNLKTLKLESIEACIAFNVLRRFNRCYNSLTSIEFNNCKFNESISYNGFDQLTQLQSFHLNYCEGLTEKIFEALQDIPVLSNIRTLSVRGKIITGLDLLIQRIGTNLEHVHLELNGFVERGKVFESVANYCDKIKYFYFNCFNDRNMKRIHKIIINNRNHLKYLSFYNTNARSRANSEILQELGQILPDSIDYLNFGLFIDPNDLNIFLQSVKNIQIKKLLVTNFSKEIVSIFNILKEFVTENNIKDFSYQVSDIFRPESVNHQNLENEIRIFAKMKFFNDIVVNITDF